MQEVVEVIVGKASRFEHRHWSPFDGLRPAIGHRGGEVAGVEPIAFLWVGGGEVVEGEAKIVAPIVMLGLIPI
jgi:hypothetical protein